MDTHVTKHNPVYYINFALSGCSLNVHWSGEKLNLLGRGGEGGKFVTVYFTAYSV